MAGQEWKPLSTEEEMQRVADRTPGLVRLTYLHDETCPYLTRKGECECEELGLQFSELHS